MAETRMEFWHRRGRELHGMRKAELIALYRKLGGLGGTYPPEKWTKEEVLTSVADIEWRRLPDDQKKAAPEQMSPPCDECGKGQDVAAHAYGGSHNYVVTNDPCKPWVPSREPCAAPECGRPYEHHRTWSLGHEYQAPAEEQPAAWKCVDCGYEDSERSLICPNCATDGELMAEEQPAAPADATAEDEGEPLIKPLTGFDLQMLARYRGPSDVQPQGQYIERPSGPPVRVDGPGCTPAVPPPVIPPEAVREFMEGE